MDRLKAVLFQANPLTASHRDGLKALPFKNKPDESITLERPGSLFIALFGGNWLVCPA